MEDRAINATPGRRRTPLYTPSLDTRAGRPRKREERAGPRPLGRAWGRTGSGLLLVGVALAVAALFLTYVRGAEINASNRGLTMLHVLPLVAWVAAALLALPGRREARRAAAGLALGSSVVVAGLDVAAIGQLVSGHLHGGLGFWLSTASGGLGLLAGLVLVTGLARSATAGPDRRWPHAATALIAVGGAAAGVGYAFGWRRYRIVSKVLHTTGHHTIPGVFDDSATVTVGAAMVVAGLAVVPLLALGWRSRRGAGAVAVGAFIGLAGYVALNLDEVIGRASLGLSPAVIQRYGVRLSADVTGWFVLAAAGLVLLAGTGLWLLVGARLRNGAE